MRDYVTPTDRTHKIHSMIILVCNMLTTSYESKKHGGFNIYQDDKIQSYVDTYVPNVTLNVKTPKEGKTILETVFSCNYNGDFVTYHEGEWERHLETLYAKAQKVKAQKDEEARIKREEAKAQAEAPASPEADKVFQKKTLSADEVIAEVADILKEADGDFIEHIANEVLGRKVVYVEDSMFEYQD